MRAVRGCIVGVSIVALAASVTGCGDTSMVSSKGCYEEAVYVTGEAPDGLGHDYLAAFTMTDDEGAPTAYDVEASDPRLSGAMSRVEGGRRSFAGGSCDWAWASVEAHTWMLVNDGGRWVGPATAFAASNDDIQVATVTLRGEGVYAGWTAHLVFTTGDDTEEPARFTGLLFPGPMPSPPATHGKRR